MIQHNLKISKALSEYDIILDHKIISNFEVISKKNILLEL